ncbi:MAG TPA: hypothetical protein VFC78_10800 [Tepidisphaeraceae bacterium]|nr:hypothetical protein [Tepidisphaeraceae bacterium]
MKTIPIEELDHRVADALKERNGNDPVLLTENATGLGLLLRLPSELKNSEIDVAVMPLGVNGTVLMVLQSKAAIDNGPAEAKSAAQPRFGNCLGMLTVVAEDDEHLHDFAEYM